MPTAAPACPLRPPARGTGIAGQPAQPGSGGLPDRFGRARQGVRLARQHDHLDGRARVPARRTGHGPRSPPAPARAGRRQLAGPRAFRVPRRVQREGQRHDGPRTCRPAPSGRPPGRRCCGRPAPAGPARPGPGRRASITCGPRCVLPVRVTGRAASRDPVRLGDHGHRAAEPQRRVPRAASRSRAADPAARPVRQHEQEGRGRRAPRPPARPRHRPGQLSPGGPGAGHDLHAPTC